MKKLLIIITLFISSFFFVSNEVNASELTLDITLDRINDTFLNIKNLSDEFIKNNNNYYTYIIVYTDDYYVYFFQNSDNREFRCNNYGTNLSCYFSVSFVRYKLSNDSLVNTGYTSSSFTSTAYSSFSNILYSSIPCLYNRGSSTDILNLNYSGKTFTVLYGETIPLVYDLYLLDNLSSNNHDGEIKIISNFYNVCIEKLSFLSEKLVGNYIYLSIFVVFIFIFVFELIRRRFL